MLFMTLAMISRYSYHSDRHMNQISSRYLCDGCKECYVGQTGDIIRHRFTVHRHQALPYADYVPVKADRHLRICGKNKYKVFPFFRPKKNTTIYREMQEERWIKIMKPKLNALLV